MAEVTALFGALKGIWWPLAAVIVAIVYKMEFRSLLPRLRKAGPTGVEFDPAQQQASVTAGGAPPAPGQLREFPGLVRTPVIEQVERQLHANLGGLTNLSDEEKRDLLVRVLAQTQLEAAFDRTYNIIFGSQIVLLRRLNDLGRMSLADARAFYDTYAVAKFPEVYSQYSFDQWIHFLSNNFLVTLGDGFVEATELGRNFLVHLTNRRLTEYKPG
jgi:hypothetical protein